MAHKKDLLLDSLKFHFPKHAILLKMRSSKESGAFVYERFGDFLEQETFICSEAGAQYEIHTDPRHDFGLYLDTKAAREFVKKNADNKTVLNLFSYTCPFAVSAMLGGASSVTNIDPNKDYLSWGEKNAQLNSVVYKRYPDTTQDYLRRHLRRIDSGKDQAYDMVIIDPPAFLVGRGSERLARNLWPEWLENLKNSGCLEFVIIINDKSLGRQNDLELFFKQGLGNDIKVREVEQSLDVKGQGLKQSVDHFYFTPKIFHLTR